MIKLAKTSTTEIVEVFQIIGEKVILSEDEKEIQIAFPPLAKAISKELIDLNINRTYSCVNNIVYIKLYGSVSQTEVIEYKFEMRCGLLLIVKKTYGVSKEQGEDSYES